MWVSTNIHTERDRKNTRLCKDENHEIAQAIACKKARSLLLIFLIFSWSTTPDLSSQNELVGVCYSVCIIINGKVTTKESFCAYKEHYGEVYYNQIVQAITILLQEIVDPPVIPEAYNKEHFCLPSILHEFLGKHFVMFFCNRECSIRYSL